MREDCHDFRALFLSDAPLMDVRAPVEFAKGAFPHAVNLPLMNDDERQAVGLCYKQRGQQAAIALGHTLVSGAHRDARIAAWVRFAHAHPDGYLYCFRGGLRSSIAQQWLAEAGIAYPRVTGGYKALRNNLIQVLDDALASCQFVLLGGLTGSGKTELLVTLRNAIDLEGRANHRGSSFGKHATPQPAQIDFENMLGVDLLKKRAQGMERFVLEEEGRTVGSCCLPPTLYDNMRNYPLVWLEDSFENRVRRILQDYVIDLSAEFIALHGADVGHEQFAGQLRQSLKNITRRLGMQRYQALAALMDDALQTQRESGDTERHCAWIEALLRDYYDPMYTYQRKERSDRIIFSGDHKAVAQYLRESAD